MYTHTLKHMHAHVRIQVCVCVCVCVCVYVLIYKYMLCYSLYRMLVYLTHVKPNLCVYIVKHSVISCKVSLAVYFKHSHQDQTSGPVAWNCTWEIGLWAPETNVKIQHGSRCVLVPPHPSLGLAPLSGLCVKSCLFGFQSTVEKRQCDRERMCEAIMISMRTGKGAREKLHEDS